VEGAITQKTVRGCILKVATGDFSQSLAIQWVTQERPFPIIWGLGLEFVLTGVLWVSIEPDKLLWKSESAGNQNVREGVRDQINSSSFMFSSWY
jgi:hypothetical protein